MGFNFHAKGTKDPEDVRNWRIHMIAIIASMAALASKLLLSTLLSHMDRTTTKHSRLLVGYDTSVIGGTMALDSFKQDFGLLDTEGTDLDTLQGNIVSTFQAGCFFGSLLTFPLAEKIGRKRAILVAAAVFLLGGTLMTASHGKLAMLIVGRAVAGLGIGAGSLIVPVYIAETSPPSIRGRLIGIFEVRTRL